MERNYELRRRFERILRKLSKPQGRRQLRALFVSYYLRVFSPRALHWAIHSKCTPDKSLITQFDEDLLISLRSKDVVGRRLFVEREYEPGVTEWLTDVLKPGMIFLDVGANLGIFTLVAAKRVFPEGQVHVFEPSSVMVSELKKNLEINGFDHVIVNEVAVGDRSGHVDFPCYETGTEAYGSIVRDVWPGTTVRGFQTVTTITLDDYVARRGLERVDVIKMDIEGAEYLALKGAKNVLSQSDPLQIVLELADFNMASADYNSKTILHFLEELGFSLALLDSSGLHEVYSIDAMPEMNCTLIARKD